MTDQHKTWQSRTRKVPGGSDKRSKSGKANEHAWAEPTRKARGREGEGGSINKMYNGWKNGCTRERESSAWGY